MKDAVVVEMLETEGDPLGERRDGVWLEEDADEIVREGKRVDEGRDLEMVDCGRLLQKAGVEGGIVEELGADKFASGVEELTQRCAVLCHEELERVLVLLVVKIADDVWVGGECGKEVHLHPKALGLKVIAERETELLDGTSPSLDKTRKDLAATRPASEELASCRVSKVVLLALAHAHPRPHRLWRRDRYFRVTLWRVLRRASASCCACRVVALCVAWGAAFCSGPCRACFLLLVPRLLARRGFCDGAFATGREGRAALRVRLCVLWEGDWETDRGKGTSARGACLRFARGQRR